MPTKPQNLSREMAHAYLTGTAPVSHNPSTPANLCPANQLTHSPNQIRDTQYEIRDTGHSLLHLSSVLYKFALLCKTNPIPEMLI